MHVDTCERINRRFLSRSTEQLLRYGLRIAERPFVSTTFGPYSAVLLHQLVRLKPDIPVVWVDTGYNTRATQDIAAELCRRLALNLHVFRPRQEVLTLPPTLDDPEHSAFTRQVKLEPFARALASLRPDLWFSSLRREQTEHRAGLDFFHRSAGGLVKAAPLLHWRRADLDAYMQNHQLPNTTDYYDPTKGEARRECGLHLQL